MAIGTPAQVAKTPTHTGKFLKRFMKR